MMREMNRRSDVGVRWSAPGVKAMLMAKLERKFHHRRWAETDPEEGPAPCASRWWRDGRRKANASRSDRDRPGSTGRALTARRAGRR